MDGRRLTKEECEAFRRDWYDPDGVNEARTISALLDDLDAADEEIARLRLFEKRWADIVEMMNNDDLSTQDVLDYINDEIDHDEGNDAS